MKVRTSYVRRWRIATAGVLGRPSHPSGAGSVRDGGAPYSHLRADEVLDRERYAAANRAFWTSSVIGGAGLAVFLAAAIPAYGWVPIGLIGVPALLGTLTHAHRAGLSERRYAVSHLLWLVVAVGGCAAATGGAQSFLLPMLPMMTLAFFSRLPPRVAMSYAWVSFGLGIVPVLLTDWVGVRNNPWLLGSCAIGLLSFSLVASQMAAGEIHHRSVATIDQLTGLLNRRGLAERLTEITQQAVVISDDTPLALIACDLDHFKEVNDTFGHLRGDAVLRDVAYIIRTALRRFELAYRMGGEEFLIVLPGHDETAATAVADSIRLAIETARPGGLNVTISMGVAVGRAADVRENELMLAADAAVYAAKRAGRNQVVVAPSGAPGAGVLHSRVDRVAS